MRAQDWPYRTDRGRGSRLFLLARLEKCDQIVQFGGSENPRKRWHVVAAVHDANRQVLPGQSISYPGEIGTAFSAVAAHLVAIFASLVMEHTRTRHHRA